MSASSSPSCRFCAQPGPGLRRVQPDGDDTRSMTRSRRAITARLDRLNPIFEHPACLTAAEQARTVELVRRAELAAEFKRQRAAGADEATLLALLDEMDR